MKQCSKGHIYDEKMYTECPYCNQNGSVGVRPLASDFPKTAPLDAGGSSNFPATAPLDVSSSPNFPATMPLDAPSAPKAPPKKEMSATIALNTNGAGISPVCGWLVVTQGDNKGKSYVIHSDKNPIGRGQQFDVDLSFDKAVSKDGDAVIAYDSRSRKFFVTLSAGKNNIYLNGNLLLTPEEIKDYDELEIGATHLVFRSFCNSEFAY